MPTFLGKYWCLFVAVDESLHQLNGNGWNLCKQWKFFFMKCFVRNVCIIWMFKGKNKSCIDRGQNLTISEYIRNYFFLNFRLLLCRHPLIYYLLFCAQQSPHWIKHRHLYINLLITLRWLTAFFRNTNTCILYTVTTSVISTFLVLTYYITSLH